METMQALIEEFGEDCLDVDDEELGSSYKWSATRYKGLKIIRCNDKNFDAEYFTILNLKNNKHVHSITEAMAFKICDCYSEMSRRGTVSRRYSRATRNKAMKLEGYCIRYK